MTDTTAESLKSIEEIRSLMNRSSRFLSLSGMSGIWAGCVALAGTIIAYLWLPYSWLLHKGLPYRVLEIPFLKIIGLAMAILILAIAGGLYFTWKKVRRQGGQLWSRSSRQLLVELAIPLTVGGFFCLGFLYYQQALFVSPACLVFYGLALINGSKYTLSDIKFLGFLEIILGLINLFNPGNGIIYWGIGFGLLHILYGIFMWNKYDKNEEAEA